MAMPSTLPSTTVAGAGFIALDLLLPSGQGGQLLRRAGGTCGNVLAILSFLGFNSVPIARLGTDKAAEVLISDLESMGVNCEHVQCDPAARTPRVVEFLPESSGRAHRFVFTCPTCQRRFPRRSEPIFEQADESIRQVNPALFFFDRAGSTTIKLAIAARELGALVMFEPDSFANNSKFDKALQMSDIVKYSAQRVGQSIEPWLRKIDKKPRLVVETMHGRGLRYVTRRGLADLEWNHQEPFQVRSPVDQAGAGDWCSAGLIARLLTIGAIDRWREGTIHQALAFGQALAAASILFKGPRGYLENTPRRTVLRVARSTLRWGKLSECLANERRVSPESRTLSEQDTACVLCLAPT